MGDVVEKVCDALRKEEPFLGDLLRDDEVRALALAAIRACEGLLAEAWRNGRDFSCQEMNDGTDYAAAVISKIEKEGK